MLHYWLPLSPSSASRFDPDLWQAYVKANKVEAASSIITPQTVSTQCMHMAWPLLSLDYQGICQHFTHVPLHCMHAFQHHHPL